MSYWTGLVSGFDEHRQKQDQENYTREQAQRAQQNKVFETLLQSEDPRMKELALSGMMDPIARKKGWAGYLGKYEVNPIVKQIAARMQEGVLVEPPAPGAVYPAGSAGMSPNAPVSPGSTPVPPAAAGGVPGGGTGGAMTEGDMARIPVPPPLAAGPAGPGAARPGPQGQGPQGLAPQPQAPIPAPPGPAGPVPPAAETAVNHASAQLATHPGAPAPGGAGGAGGAAAGPPMASGAGEAPSGAIPLPPAQGAPGAAPGVMGVAPAAPAAPVPPGVSGAAPPVGIAAQELMPGGSGGADFPLPPSMPHAQYKRRGTGIPTAQEITAFNAMTAASAGLQARESLLQRYEAGGLLTKAEATRVRLDILGVNTVPGKNTGGGWGVILPGGPDYPVPTTYDTATGQWVLADGQTVVPNNARFVRMTGAGASGGSTNTKIKDDQEGRNYLLGLGVTPEEIGDGSPTGYWKVTRRPDGSVGVQADLAPTNVFPQMTDANGNLIIKSVDPRTPPGTVIGNAPNQQGNDALADAKALMLVVTNEINRVEQPATRTGRKKTIDQTARDAIVAAMAAKAGLTFKTEFELRKALNMPTRLQVPAQPNAAPAPPPPPGTVPATGAANTPTAEPTRTPRPATTPPTGGARGGGGGGGTGGGGAAPVDVTAVEKRAREIEAALAAGGIRPPNQQAPVPPVPPPPPSVAPGRNRSEQGDTRGGGDARPPRTRTPDRSPGRGRF